MNDQTAKADSGKPKLTLVPRAIICAIARIREYGVNKYPHGGADNWRKVISRTLPGCGLQTFPFISGRPTRH